MGRLFWRFFWFFWLAQVTTTLAVGGSVWLIYRLTSATMPALLQPPQHPPSLFPLLMPMLVGGVVSLVFAGLMAAYFTRPIRRLDQAFKAIAAGQLDERIGGVLGAPDNELTALGPGFDHMAGRLQALVESHRRLLHDVSHEMRAPLARLQAAAELMGKSPQRIAELSERQQRDIERALRIDALVKEIHRKQQVRDDGGDAQRDHRARDEHKDRKTRRYETERFKNQVIRHSPPRAVPAQFNA